MAQYITKEQAMSFPFANGKYDHENANEHFIYGCETYKEWLETLPPIFDDQEEYATLSILDEIDKMQEFIDAYPPNYPKHDVLKLEISVAEQLKKIYKILFYIMTRQK